MMLLRNGVLDPNTGDPAAIAGAKDAVLQLINDNGARLTINGTYAKLPEGEFTVTQSWSGDIVGAKQYLPPGTSEDILGYWYPSDKKGLIGNDTIAIPTAAQSPRLAHEFLNFFLDEQWGFVNFSEWNGYQPPLHVDPARPAHQRGDRPAEPDGRGPRRGELHPRLRPGRAGRRRRRALARRLERDPGWWLAPPSPRHAGGAAGPTRPHGRGSGTRAGTGRRSPSRGTCGSRSSSSFRSTSCSPSRSARWTSCSVCRSPSTSRGGGASARSARRSRSSTSEIASTSTPSCGRWSTCSRRARSASSSATPSPTTRPGTQAGGGA